MNLIKYKNYDEYKKFQIKTNKRKIDRVFAKEEIIEQICYYLSTHLGVISQGLCHGTRRGKEQEWFSKYLRCEILGTEISPTAKDFPNTLEWDFNKEREDWSGKWYFVYSNSLDHSPNPIKTLKVWKNQLIPSGYLILEWTKAHNLSNQKSDPFSANVEEYKDLLRQTGFNNIDEIKIRDRIILFAKNE